jgi:hypothetical protein
VTITFPLPPVWAGQELGVKIVAQPLSSTALLRPGQGVQSAITAATTFSYYEPFVEQLYVMRAHFNGTNTTAVSHHRVKGYPLVREVVF